MTWLSAMASGPLALLDTLLVVMALKVRIKVGSSGFPVGGIRAQMCVSGAVSEGLGWHYS
jgi:hypothetical protein